MRDNTGRAGVTDVHGLLTIAPNPCTTRPCLPGVVLAIDGADGRYFLTRGLAWLRDVSALAAAITVGPGDLVVATGVIGQGTDVDGEQYRTLDVTQVRRES